jgi:hypothetical protein
MFGANESFSVSDGLYGTYLAGKYIQCLVRTSMILGGKPVPFGRGAILGNRTLSGMLAISAITCLAV